MAQERPKPGPDEMYCSNCGAVVKRQANFCQSCGARLSAPAQPAAAPQPPPPPPPAPGPITAPPPAPVAPAVASAVARSDRSRLAAGILGVILGWAGVHRFYLGHVGIGILQLIVTMLTLGIGGLWGFIEGIIILADGSFKDAEGKPLRHYSE